MKKADKDLPVSTLLRLACMFAESEQAEYLACIANHADDHPEKVKTRAFLKQLRAYRLKRWGKSKLDKALEAGRPVPIAEVMKLHEAKS